MLGSTERRENGSIIEGVLHCSETDCQQEFPIIDGIPILVSDVRAYLAANLMSITARSDLSPTSQSILGDACGPDSQYDTTRQHLSIYGWDAYGEFDDDAQTGSPGSIARCLRVGIELSGDLQGPIIDLGCSVGRSTFELAAETDDLVLGIDLNFGMLRLAHRVLTDGMAIFPRRRIGVVYDARRVQTPFDKNGTRVDFWACDALALPFRPESFNSAVALNLLDCLQTPHELLHTLDRLLKPRGQAIISSPYDWSTAATPMETWIGGHSQRGPLEGNAENLLQALLTPGAHPQSVRHLAITAQQTNVPWQTRLHARSTMQYQTHVLVLHKADGAN